MPRKTDAKYPLDPWHFDYWVYSKGHHDIVDFGAVVYEEGLGNIVTHTFRHRWARCVPVPGSDMGLVFCDGPGRGAFPITEAEAIHAALDRAEADRAT